MKMISAQILFMFLFTAAGLAWNIPGHMLSGAIAYQILQRRLGIGSDDWGSGRTQATSRFRVTKH
jgi:hypothetical protein